MRLAVGSLLALVLASCTNPQKTTWAVEFEEPWGGPEPELVVLEIRAGGCDGAPVYEQSLRRDELATVPDTLDDGLYGFSASARDARCDIVGETCVEVRMPEDAGAIETRIDADPPTPACPGQACDAGRCVACMPGWSDCDGVGSNGCEVDTLTSLENCGACNEICGEPQRPGVCSEGVCALDECDDGFDDCDGESSNGCEANLAADVDHCGMCRRTCESDERCAGGACIVPTCAPGLDECDGDMATECETDLRTSAVHCGACGASCGIGSACIEGLCDDTIVSMSAKGGFSVRLAGREVQYVAQDTFHLDPDEATVFSETVGLSASAANQRCVGRSGSIRCTRGRDTEPTDHPDPGDVVAIGPTPRSRMPDTFTAALRRNGEIVRWHRTGVPAELLPLPAAVDFFVAHGIDLGAVCAVTAEDEVHCVGDRYADRFFCEDTTPTEVRRVEGFEGLRARAFAGDHFCAITDAGQVVCGGSLEYGRLGLGPGPAGLECMPPAPVRDIEDARAVAVEQDVSCAIDGAGDLYCWGRGEPAFDDSPVDHVYPERIDAPPAVDLLLSSGAIRLLGEDGVVHVLGGTSAGAHDSARGAREVAIGEHHVCALRSNGRVACWGYNGNGQLGDGTTAEARTPRLVEGLPLARDITAGDAHTCAVTYEREVYCWGTNLNGQLGTTGPQSIEPVLVPGVSDIVQLETMESLTCARDLAGGVTCWGHDPHEILGAGTTLAPTPMGMLEPIRRLQLLPSSICGLTPDGRVVCATNDAQSEMELSGSARGVVGFDAGICGVRSSAVECVGYLALPDGSSENAFTPAPPMDLGTGAVWDLAATGRHMCAVLRDSGQFACWGHGDGGRLGRGPVTGDLQAMGAVLLAGDPPTPLEHVTRVWASRETSCARAADGALYCWGAGDAGQLGDGRSRDSEYAVRVVGF